MGTYTTNYQLYMPSVGETGWGTLINGNFSTIDTTMKGLSNRITAVENEVNGALSCTSVTTSGKITGNGGIIGTTGTFSGAVTGANATFSGDVKASNIGRFKRLNIVDINHAISDYYGSSVGSGGSSGSIIEFETILYSTSGIQTFNVSGLFNSLTIADTEYFLGGVGNATNIQFQVTAGNCSASIVCNGVTTSISAGGSVNISASRLSEFMQNMCIVTLTPTGSNARLWLGYKNNNSFTVYACAY